MKDCLRRPLREQKSYACNFIYEPTILFISLQFFYEPAIFIYIEIAGKMLKNVTYMEANSIIFILEYLYLLYRY